MPQAVRRRVAAAVAVAAVRMVLAIFFGSAVGVIRISFRSGASQLGVPGAAFFLAPDDVVRAWCGADPQDQRSLESAFTEMADTSHPYS
ncbi:hypothetical protein Afil01_18740 [Actinorhabdospora filicis]|uniref:Uncharacterized protein n=1 Tax=Actinorhabdospora filicis TaxID=1785913 RepID=A0A9W6SJG4_9ACTN|nr:hypothetical protein Afil01_18740 [Actinorhabdospora filicis]